MGEPRPILRFPNSGSGQSTGEDAYISNDSKNLNPKRTIS